MRTNALGYRVPTIGRQIAEKDAEKYAEYYKNILRAKVKCCTVLAVLFPLSLSLNTKQMECKIFQLVAVTIKATKYFGKKQSFYNDCALKANDFLHYLRHMGSFF